MNTGGPLQGTLEELINVMIEIQKSTHHNGLEKSSNESPYHMVLDNEN